jgi:hypothetical protein
MLANRTQTQSLVPKRILMVIVPMLRDRIVMCDNHRKMAVVLRNLRQALAA